MKKILLISATALLLVSCSDLQTQFSSQQNKIVVPSARNPVLQQTDFYLTESGANYLFDLIQRDLSINSIREYQASQMLSPMEVYSGETLVVNNINGDRIKIISSPIKSDYTFNVNGNSLNFNSLYQGEYIAELYSGFTYIGTIKIKNKLKYNFTEKDNYDIILNSYNNKNLDLLLKSAQLYQFAFPDNSKQKDVAFFILNLSSENKNQLSINKQVSYLKENFSLNENDKIKLLLIEENNTSGTFIINNYYLDYNKNNLKLNTEIMRVIKRKNTAVPEELNFLEQFYNDSQDSTLSSLIGELYAQRGEIEKSNYYLNSGSQLPSTIVSETTSNRIEEDNRITTVVNNEPLQPFVSDSQKDLASGIDALNRKSYNEALIFFNKVLNESNNNSEAYFYRGKTYFSMNDFNKSLIDLEKVDNPQANTSELYYYLGVIYHRKGEIEKSKDYLRKSRENDPNSTWGRRSSIYLLKL